MSVIPFWVKLLALGIVALLIGGGIWYWHHETYATAFAAGSADVQKKWDDSVQAAKDAQKAQKATADADIKPVQDQAQPQIDASKERVVTVVKTVEKIVHDNPTFAACTRPAALDSVRQAQLKAAAAAAGGYAPAPSSSADPGAGSSAGAAQYADGGK